MRLQSSKTIAVRGTVIGGSDLLICLPLVAATKADLLDQAGALTPLHPDLLEWRIDGYGRVTDIDASLQALAELRAAIGDLPLIFTCRIDAEGGYAKIDPQIRRALVEAVIPTGMVDIVDIEMCNEPSFIDSVIDVARRHAVKLILSYHDFERTPSEAFILDTLVAARDRGADIAKVAVTSRNYHDVLALLGATLKARTEKLDIPLVTMAMGPEGAITRLAGGLFGSDITFAVGKEASAPGQIPFDALKRVMGVLYA